MKILINLLKTPAFVVGIGLFILTLLMAYVLPVFYPVDTVTRVGMPYMAPTAQYWLGTNHLGVDMVSLLVKGLRASLYVGLLAGIIATIVGTLLGIYAGYTGGLQDDIINLITNLFIVIPQMVLLILISSSVKEGRSLALI